MQLNNKQLGNKFENELGEILSGYGFWVHLLNMNKSGQPADIIAVRNKVAYLIDAKVVSTKQGFALSRVEDNQDLAMDIWNEKGNGQGWFALKVKDKIFMIPHICIKAYMIQQSILSIAEITTIGKPIEKWVTRCK